MKFLLFAASLISAGTLTNAYAMEKGAGFSLDKTRVIYRSENKEATIGVVNSADNAPFLAQSWISNNEQAPAVASEKAPFVITPPLYRQDKGKNTLRIVKAGGMLPNDRESAFWINVKAIPAQKKPDANANTVSMAFVMRIKMFYRPEGLSVKPEEAHKQLTFKRANAQLMVNNPTPYFITLNKVTVDGKAINDLNAMVPPFAQQGYQLPANVTRGELEYWTLNDQGGATQPIKKSLTQ